MPVEARLLISLAIASAIVYWATPVAIRIADRLQFYDHPVGYKGHAAPTPYLGGAAVVAGFAVVVVALGGDWGRTAPLLTGVGVLWAVGTLDDRRTLRPSTRIGVEVALGALLWALGLGWDLQVGAGIDLVVTAFWIVAVVNAFNLFDNMDGAASTMAAVIAAGLALFGVVQGSAWLAVSAMGLCGACLGFLPHNLFASPARIFLGDGGSMPIGFAVAGLTMAGASGAALPWQSLAMGLLFVGIPALDTALVILSRRRRGLSILTAGRDHLTHRTQARVRTARAVAFALGGAQAVVSAMAVVAVRGGPGALVAVVVAYMLAAGIAIAALDSGFDPAHAPAGAVHRRRPGLDWPSLAVLVPLAAGLGASPFFGGYYDSGLWVPIGLGLLAIAAAALIARPFALTGPAALVLAGLAGLALLSLASSSWADSGELAVVAGNRWLVYLILVLVLLAAVRSERSAAWMLGLTSIAALAVAGVVVARLLGPDPARSFLGPRLNAPLGYINGEGAFFVLAAWPCLAAAEQRRSAPLSGAGLAGAVLFGSLALLSQSRGVALGFAVSALIVVTCLPGRVRRGWTLVAFGAAVALAAPALLEVYDSARGGVVTSEAATNAARAALLAAVAGGVAWGAMTAASTRLEQVAPASRRLATGAVIAAAAVAVVVLVVTAGTVSRTAREQYDAFIRLAPEAQQPAEIHSTRLLSGAGHRYDYWRVAWSAFRDHPAGGVGAGNYPEPYFERRATEEDVRQPHSIELQTLAELGLAGAALVAGLIAGLAWGAARLARAARTSARSRGLAVAAVGTLVAWLVHTSVDWLHLIPGVTGIALGAAVVLVRAPDAGAAGAAQPRRAARPRARLALACSAALLLAIAGVALSRQGLAEHYRSAAQAALPRDPARALTEADRSLRIDPDDIDAYYVKAAALARFNQGATATATLLAAARRAPENFVTWALLGDLAVRMGQESKARGYYRRALRLNPRDRTLRALARNPARRVGAVRARTSTGDG